MANLFRCGGGSKAPKEGSLVVLNNESFSPWTNCGSVVLNYLPNSVTIYGKSSYGDWAHQYWLSPLTDLSKFNGVRIKGSGSVKATNSAIMCHGYIHIMDKSQNILNTLYSIGTSSTSSSTINVDVTFDYDMEGYIALDLYTYQKNTGNYFAMSFSEFILTSEADNKYLYKDGTQNVAWDNSGHSLGGPYINDGGFDFNETYINCTMPTTKDHSRSIVNNSAIDISDYSKLKIMCEGGNDIYSLDISNILTVAYITINTVFTTSYYSLQVHVCPNKDNFAYDIYAYKNLKSSTSIHTPKINRVWLEK